MLLSLPVKTIVYTLLALLAFAGNSILCRLALSSQSIDATSFTVIRLLSGALTLYILWVLKERVLVSGRPSDESLVSAEPEHSRGNWLAAFMLFAYAALFSYAYLLLDTGVGALVLFGIVQITMIMVGIFRGDKLHLGEYLGVLIAFAGFVYLMWPSINSNSAQGSISIVGFVLMSLAGMAWGGYTLMGHGATNPLQSTAFNFLKSLPFAAVILLVLMIIPLWLSPQGVVLAVASGAITSGLGYAIWYAALPGLSVVQAAVVQLLVPVIAGIGGILWVREGVSIDFVTATFIILGGIALVIASRHRNSPS